MIERKVFGYNIYSNFELNDEKWANVAAYIIEAVNNFLCDKIGKCFLNGDEGFTIEAGIYDFGSGPTDIRVWRVFPA